jgi:hypothetical protein
MGVVEKLRFCNRLMVQKFEGVKRGAYTKGTYGNKTDVLFKAHVGYRGMAKKATFFHW